MMEFNIWQISILRRDAELNEFDFLLKIILLF